MFQAFRTTAVAIQRLFNHYDTAICRNLDEKAFKQYPPIFIVGSPRTGSTLLYQLLLRQFHLSYISNTMALLPMHMIKLARIYPKAASSYVGMYKENKYGYVAGMFSPNEAGKILNKWFQDIKLNRHQKEVRNTVLALTTITQAPFILKNQINTTRLDVLQKVFPESRYIFLRRDILHTAQSILLTRRDLYGNDKVWWSVTPPGYEQVLDQDVYYQVVWQVMRLEQIAEAACKENPERSLIIDYEVFCDNPYATLTQIQQRFNLNWRGDASELEPLTAANRVRLSSEEWSRLEDAYQRVMDDLSFTRQP